MAASQDTEITLGTGRMLGAFFGLVILCAVFFGLGFTLGKSSVRTVSAAEPGSPVTTAGGAVRPSANKEGSPDPAALYKTLQQKDAQPPAENTAPAASAPTSTPDVNANPPAQVDAMAAPPLNGYYVQVAAVSKQEDAQALVDSLKKKQYPAFVASSAPADKLFRVQVGPYADIKDAEAMRAKLVADGYNPILKK